MQIIVNERKPVRRENDSKYKAPITPSRSMGRPNDWTDDVTSTAYNGSYGGGSRDGARNMIAYLWRTTTHTLGSGTRASKRIGTYRVNYLKEDHYELGDNNVPIQCIQHYAQGISRCYEHRADVRGLKCQHQDGLRTYPGRESQMH